MNIMNAHFGKYALERKASCFGSLFKQFESALYCEKGILQWIAEHQDNLNDHFGKLQTTVLQKYSKKQKRIYSKILHRAIQENNEFAVEALIRAGADVDIKNIDGNRKIRKKTLGS